MAFWEESGRRHGLKSSSGFLPGGDASTRQAKADYGETWSGGQIEVSLRKVLQA